MPVERVCCFVSEMTFNPIGGRPRNPAAPYFPHVTQNPNVTVDHAAAATQECRDLAHALQTLGVRNPTAEQLTMKNLIRQDYHYASQYEPSTMSRPVGSGLSPSGINRATAQSTASSPTVNLFLAGLTQSGRQSTGSTSSSATES